MRGKTSGAAGFAGSVAAGFAWATIFAAGGFVSATTGATGGGAGCSYANSGGFGGAGADGGESLLAACATPNQRNALSAPITSNAPSKIHTNGEVRRGAGCGIVAAA